MEVGIKQLRDHLSRHLEEVRRGASITVTDHGKPVARLVPLDEDPRIAQMIRDGTLIPPRAPKQERRDLGIQVPTEVIDRILREMRDE